MCLVHIALLRKRSRNAEMVHQTKKYKEQLSKGFAHICICINKITQNVHDTFKICHAKELKQVDNIMPRF